MWDIFVSHPFLTTHKAREVPSVAAHKDNKQTCVNNTAPMEFFLI